MKVNFTRKYCWWFRNPAITTFGMYKTPRKWWDFIYQPQLVSFRRISGCHQQKIPPFSPTSCELLSPLNLGWGNLKKQRGEARSRGSKKPGVKGVHPQSLAVRPWKMKGRRSGFLLGVGNFSGAFAVKLWKGTFFSVLPSRQSLGQKKTWEISGG